jgi:hypothetical protein
MCDGLSEFEIPILASVYGAFQDPCSILEKRSCSFDNSLCTPTVHQLYTNCTPTVHTVHIVHENLLIFRIFCKKKLQQKTSTKNFKKKLQNKTSKKNCQKNCKDLAIMTLRYSLNNALALAFVCCRALFLKFDRVFVCF